MRTASRVFGAISIFAFAAAALFATGARSRTSIQGALVLSLFGLANAYLWRVLGHQGRHELDGLVVPGAPSLDDVQHNDPEALHLPGPSVFPAVYAVAAGLILIGLITSIGVSVAGLGLFVVASIGWGVQAIREHAFAEAHAGHQPAAAELDHEAVALAHQIAAFRASHRGATASVQHLGRDSARIVLVGGDGAWGDLVTGNIALADQACSLAGVECSSTWPSGLAHRIHADPHLWERMGGGAHVATHAPRDGYLQVGARVFLSIALFAFFAASLFALGVRNRTAIQGTLILTMFGIANIYLYIFMRNARGAADDVRYATASGIAAEALDPAPPLDPEHIHLPGPSIWPAVFAVSAGLVFIGLITAPAVSGAGLVLFVVAAGGWTVQAVGEHKLALAGGHQAGHADIEPVDDGAVPVDHVSAGQTH
jgi:hypothetical protein